jgi:hypothetical protein
VSHQEHAHSTHCHPCTGEDLNNIDNNMPPEIVVPMLCTCWAFLLLGISSQATWPDLRCALSWIPGYNGFAGNEEANMLAKEVVNIGPPLLPSSILGRWNELSIVSLNLGNMIGALKGMPT